MADVELGRLVITRELTDAGHVVVALEHSDGLPLYDAVAMLAFAQAGVFEQYAIESESDDDDD